MDASSSPAVDAGDERSFQARSARLGFALGARIPFGVSHAVGGALGGLAYSIPGRTRTVTRVNLELCFPELSPAQRARLGRASTAEAGRLAFELGGIWSWPAERIQALHQGTSGEQHFEAARAGGRGVLVITMHFGSWELLGLLHSLRMPMTSLYKPPRVGKLEDFYKNGRERFGAKLVPTSSSGVGAIVKTLRRGELVALLPDQDPGQGAGVFAPFFGVPANTSVLVPRLLQRTGAGAVFGVTERLADGSGFRLHYLPASEELWSEDPVVSASALNAGLESAIRIAPAQYLWSYKRFRIRPPGEGDPYRPAG